MVGAWLGMMGRRGRCGKDRSAMPIVEGYFTAVEAAQELGISVTVVHKAVQRGHLTAIHPNARVSLIPAADVERYKVEHRGRRGRPRTREEEPPARR